MPKFATRVVLHQPNLHEQETVTVYDIKNPPGRLRDNEYVTEYVIGYVEHPRYYTVGRHGFFSDFVDAIEDRATDHYWFEDRLSDSERSYLEGDRHE